MAFRSEKQALQAKYLLGQLSEQERVGVEESYFVDDNSFQELEIVEDELIDAYVHDELDSADRHQFEKLLASSTRLSGRAQFARILARCVGARDAAQTTGTVAPERPVKAKDRHSWWQKIFGVQAGRKFAFAGAVVMVLMAVALLFTWMQLQESSRRLERERVALQQQKEALEGQSSGQASQINQLAADLEKERNLRAEDQKLIESLRNAVKESPSPSRVIVSLFLTPGLTRDASDTGRTLTVRSKQSDVRLLLALPEDGYNSYRATLKDQDDKEIVHRDGLRSRRTRNGNQIVFQFSAAIVSSGDYIVSVSGQTSSGLEPLPDYAFRLIQAR